MKVVILAGGLGSRISEESLVKPKPLIEVGGRPILWHIMKIYSHYGLNEFIVCLGYKGYMIKEYFSNFFLHHSDVTVDTSSNEVKYLHSTSEPWRVTLVDTGAETLTGGRLKRVGKYLASDEPFCFTYGDGVCDINATELIAFHRAHGKLATVTAVLPPGRYGALDIRGDLVQRFLEKPRGDQGFVNGGFFVLDPRVIDRISGDETSWESGPLESLSDEGQLVAYRHRGFWQAMDTLRDKQKLEELWLSGYAPWKLWA